MCLDPTDATTAVVRCCADQCTDENAEHNTWTMPTKQEHDAGTPPPKACGDKGTDGPCDCLTFHTAEECIAAGSLVGEADTSKVNYCTHVKCDHKNLVVFPIVAGDATSFDVQNNPDITEISDNALADAKNVHKFYVSTAGFTHFQAGVFAGLKSVKIMELSITHITMLVPDTFRGVSSLETLTMVDNKRWESIAPTAMSGLIGLVKLELKNNLKLKLNVFDALPKLKSLFIINCASITTIPAGAFAALPSLFELAIELNQALSLLTFGSFEGAGSLGTLSLKDNRALRRIEDNTFEGLAGLTKLQLISTPNPDDRLGEGIATIGPKTLVGLTSLEDLTLDIAGLSTIDPEALAECPALTSLTILSARGMISDLSSDVFSGVRGSLTQLSLKGLNMSAVSPLLLRDMVELERLSIMCFQNLEELAANTFSTASKLKKLELSRNGIKSIVAGTFNGLDQLDELKLRSNQRLSIVESRMFEGAFKKSTLSTETTVMLDLRNNPWTSISPNFNSYLDEIPVKLVVLLSSSAGSALDECCSYLWLHESIHFFTDGLLCTETRSPKSCAIEHGGCVNTAMCIDSAGITSGDSNHSQLNLSSRGDQVHCVCDRHYTGDGTVHGTGCTRNQFINSTVALDPLSQQQHALGQRKIPIINLTDNTVWSCCLEVGWGADAKRLDMISTKRQAGTFAELQESEKELLVNFCANADSWNEQGQKLVKVVHADAGQGNTSRREPSKGRVTSAPIKCSEVNDTATEEASCNPYVKPVFSQKWNPGDQKCFQANQACPEGTRPELNGRKHLVDCEPFAHAIRVYNTIFSIQEMQCVACSVSHCASCPASVKTGCKECAHGYSLFYNAATRVYSCRAECPELYYSENATGTHMCTLAETCDQPGVEFKVWPTPNTKGTCQNIKGYTSAYIGGTLGFVFLILIIVMVVATRKQLHQKRVDIAWVEALIKEHEEQEERGRGRRGGHRIIKSMSSMISHMENDRRHHSVQSENIFEDEFSEREHLQNTSQGEQHEESQSNLSKALFLAIEHNRYDLIVPLLECGADSRKRHPRKGLLPHTALLQSGEGDIRTVVGACKFVFLGVGGAIHSIAEEDDESDQAKVKYEAVRALFDRNLVIDVQIGATIEGSGAEDEAAARLLKTVLVDLAVTKWVATDDSGETVAHRLMTACMNSFLDERSGIDLIAAIIEADRVSMSVPDSKGLTPSDIAVRCSHYPRVVRTFANVMYGNILLTQISKPISSKKHVYECKDLREMANGVGVGVAKTCIVKLYNDERQWRNEIGIANLLTERIDPTDHLPVLPMMRALAVDLGVDFNADSEKPLEEHTRRNSKVGRFFFFFSLSFRLLLSLSRSTISKSWCEAGPSSTWM